jgi:hypothetical protein
MEHYSNPVIYDYQTRQPFQKIVNRYDLYSVMNEYERLSELGELFDTNPNAYPDNLDNDIENIEIQKRRLHTIEMNLKRPILEAMFRKATKQDTGQDLNLQKSERDLLYEEADDIFENGTDNRDPFPVIQEEINQLVEDFLQDPANGYVFRGTGLHHLISNKTFKNFQPKYRGPF